MSTSEQSPLKAPPVLDDLPPLTTKPLVSDNDRKEALLLITDSIAQQRQTASQSIILSSLFISAWLAMLATLTKIKYHVLSDLGIIATTGSGITMALLLFVRWCSDGYVSHAESVASQGLAWFEEQKKGPHGEAEGELIVLGTRYGDDLIGALAMRLPSALSLPSSSQFYDALPKVEILAWTVKLRFRHKGIGRGLLEEAVKIARARCGRDVKISFARDHVNSKMVLMRPFNGVFRKREMKARQMLDGVIGEARGEDVEDLMSS